MNIYSKELKQYNLVCNQLLYSFMKKYYCDKKQTIKDLDWFWIADRIGSVVALNDQFWGMEDIVLALEKNVSKKKLFEYNDKSIEDKPSAPRSLYQYLHVKKA